MHYNYREASKRSILYIYQWHLLPLSPYPLSPDQGNCCNPLTCTVLNSDECGSATDCAEASNCKYPLRERERERGGERERKREGRGERERERGSGGEREGGGGGGGERGREYVCVCTW